MKTTISGHRSKHVDAFRGQSFDYVLTVCDDARESCPVFPGGGKRLPRTFDDPAVFQSREEERLALFRRQIQDYLKAFPEESRLSKEYRTAHPWRAETRSRYTHDET